MHNTYIPEGNSASVTHIYVFLLVLLEIFKIYGDRFFPLKDNKRKTFNKGAILLVSEVSWL